MKIIFVIRKLKIAPRVSSSGSEHSVSPLPKGRSRVQLTLSPLGLGAIISIDGFNPGTILEMRGSASRFPRDVIPWKKKILHIFQEIDIEFLNTYHYTHLHWLLNKSGLKDLVFEVMINMAWIWKSCLIMILTGHISDILSLL